MEKKLYIAPAVETVAVEACQMMVGSKTIGKVTEDPDDPDNVDVIIDPDGTADASQSQLMSLDDPHLWY